MRNQQESGGNRYQFRLHPAPPPSPPPLSPTSSTTTSSSSSSSSSMSATSSAASSPTLLGATTIMTSQQQKLQKPLMTKIDEVQNITNNNNNNSNNINKITNNSSNNNNNNVNKCGSEKNKVKVVKDVAGTTSTAIHLQRKQFTPTSDASNSSFSSASVAGSIQDDMSDQCSLTQAGLEEYNIRASSYYDQPALYHHQKQSSYAQSEGYHSYVSSSDSSSATPFLDRLRQESELLSRQSLNWSQNDLSSVSCNSVAPSPTPLMLNTNTMDQRQELLLQQQSPSQKNHNSSESTSSTETLKWLGSMSDVSEASHATGYSTISESVSTSQLIVHSSRVLTPKRHHSESVLYLNDNNTNNELLQQQQQQPSSATQETGKNLNSLPQMSTASSENGIVDSSNDLEGSPMLRFTPNHRHSPSYPPIHTTPQQTIYSYQQKPLLTAMSARFLRRDSNDFLNKSPSEGTKNSSHALSTTPPSAATPCKPSTDKTNNMPPSPPLKRNAENTSPASSPGSGSDTNCYRSNHRLFPVSTYTEPVHSNTSHYVLHPKPQYSAGLKKNLLKGQQQTSDKKTLPMKSLSPPNNAANTNKNSTNSTLSPPYPSWQSVAALINDFERSKNSQEQQQQQQQQQQKQTIIQGQSQKYTYMDPSKTHRVSNPALKAFQKNAVQSYFERQQQQKHSKDPQQHKIYNQLQQEQRPHSYQAAASPKEVTSEQLLRNSLPNTTTTPITTMPAVNRRNSPPEIEFTLNKKSPSPTPPPPPPRSRSLMPNLLRRSSSASDYAEFKEQYTTQNNTDSPLATVRNVSSAEKISFNDCGMPPPPPPPRGRPSFTTTRRTSSASEYAAMRDKALLQQAAAAFAQAKQNAQHAPHPYYTTPAVTANGKEGWVPERPPKNPNLRIPSPDLPPPPANTDVEVTGVSDEPLPPPPPEVYNRTVANNVSPTQSSSYTKLSQSSEVLSKPPQANRRNSFAGSSERKVKSENAAQQPPLIPKKPQNIQLAAQVTARPNSSLGQQQQQQQQQQPTKAHKVVLNGMKTPTNVLSPSAVGHNRKRLHNNATFISVQPIMEHNHVSTKSSPPPPLMPRVPVTSQSVILPGPAIAVNTKLRSNSKASYLPRQSLEKLNNLDPDHGSYKLTLNSNEDLVVSHHTKSSYDIFAQHHNHIHAQLNHHLHNHNGLPQSVLNGKLPPNNLPDVLPLGVKLHTQQAQPASPTSATPTLRYGSNNNLSNNSTSSTANSSPTASTTIYPPMYPPPPTQHRYSSPSMTAYNNNNTVTTQSYSRSQSFDATQPQNALKYMSQSTIDLKKPTSLETTLEETSTTEHLLSPAQSESNLSSPVKIKSPDPAQNNNFKPLSPCSARREFHRSVDGGGNNEARIFRAELVNATLINSHSQSAHKLVARKESLRENIEKITQLQSKLMGAHISGSFDGGNMSSFGNNYHNGNKSISPSMKSSPSLEQIADNKFTDSNTQTEQRSTEKVASISECASPKSPEYVGMVVPPLSAMNQSTDGLKLMQRSEIILRVNPIMTEAACQTDDLADGDMGRLTEHHGKDDPQMSRTTLQPRIRHPIEIDCDNISQELANLLSAQDKLVHILRPHTPKSPSDYVTNLYNPDVPSQPSRRDVGTSTLMRMKTKEKEPKDQDKDVDELMANSIDIKFKPNEVSLQINGHEESDEEDGCNQIKKKVEELIKQINRKVVILNNEQNCINEETALNDELGSNLTNKLSQKVRPLEANKFRTYIDDVGDITSLLLSLAERLARTENTLSNIEDGSEKKSLEQKRDRLFEQLDEAKRLKADIEKRGDLMANMLERYFGARENADFDYFINMKAKLITDARDIAEKIKFSEEQLNALNETLIQSDC